GPRAARVRVPRRTASGAAGAAAGRARGARATAPPHASDAARRCDERAGLRAARTACGGALARRAERDRDDRSRPCPRGRRGARDEAARLARDRARRGGGRMSNAAPRPLAAALESLTASLAPVTTLARDRKSTV